MTNLVVILSKNHCSDFKKRVATNDKKWPDTVLTKKTKNENTSIFFLSKWIILYVILWVIIMNHY